MIVVLASRYDDAARALVSRRSSDDVRLLVPADIGKVGWRHETAGATDSVAVIDDEPVPTAQICGVLSRLHAVDDAELPEVVAEDRDYVAAEITAFLTWWLSWLPCPVLNRPSPPSLSSPSWQRDRWVACAARLEIPVCPVHHVVVFADDAPDVALGAEAASDLPPTLAVTLIGETCVGDVDPQLSGHCRDLAAAAGVDVLVAYFACFDGAYRFVSADPWPDIREPAVADRILEYLVERGRTPAPAVAR